jgi:DNA invertase Pin-like site-specific DNA recombinase
MKRKPDPVLPPEKPFSVGYARVSTRDQNLDLQIDALKAFGVLPDNLHVEKPSATAKKRPLLDEAIKQLRPGDVFVVWRLDRLARNMRELYTRLDEISKAGASLKSLTENFDFSSAVGGLILGVLGTVAAFERQLTVERTQAGIKAAKSRGSRFGAKPKFTAEIKDEAFRLLTDEAWTVQQVAEHFNVKPGTVYNHFRFTHYEDGSTEVEYKK